jgi:uncharacterized membrane protein
MIRFASPEWWILAPALAGAGWAWRPLALWRPLRALCLLLLLLVLLQPQIRRLGRGLDLWVLVDRSASAVDAMAAHLGEWQSLLERSKSPDDRIFYVDYGKTPVVRAEGTEAPPDDALATRTWLAVRHALSLMPPDRASRLLVLTDGFATEPPGEIGERLVRQGVPLDYRLASSPDAPDYGLDNLRMPPRVQPGEPFIIELDVSGNPDADVPFEVRRDGNPVSRGTVAVRNGRAVKRLTDRVAAPGAHHYQARLLPVQDARSGNNAAEGWMEVAGGPHLLLVTGYQDDPLAAVLQAQSFAVETVNHPASLNAGSLSGARAVILNNVPAQQLRPDFLAALDVYVRVQGGGLLMAGGRSSFGSGGYFDSPVDDLLPVSMELRTEHRKLAVAMAIVMDRSGSMGAAVSGGVVKMDLADAGAARAIELLGAQDAVSVLAVDTESHPIVPLTRLDGAARAELTDRVRRITSAGGGIYIDVALKAGWEQLQQASAGQRHLLLFADAADSEEPGNYKELVAGIVAGGGTVSVIGMGTEADSDANLLKDIAARGKGHVYFDADVSTLPALFAQETVALARSTFEDKPVGVKPSAGWLELAAKPLDWLPAVDGYNLNYLKPDATAAAYSADEYGAPLVAFWQRGLGRAAAVSFPLGGDYSQRARAWPSYGDFLQTLTRWLMGDDVPPGLALRPRVNGEDLRLDLLYDPGWEQKLAENPPQILVAEGATGPARPLVWEKLNPGHFEARTPLTAGQWMRGAVQVGHTALPFGPVSGGTNPEWAFDRRRIAELQAVAQMSGGSERVDLTKIWLAPRREAFRDIRNWLLVSLLLAILADAVATRLGWGLLEKTLNASAGGGVPARGSRSPALQPPQAPSAPEPSTPQGTSPVDADRRSRFRRAKLDR